MSVLEIEHYEVRQIRSGSIVYRGKSLAWAAAWLDVGTCYGKGPTPLTAFRQVEAEIRKFREGEN